MKKLSLVFVLVTLFVIALVPGAMAQTSPAEQAEENQIRYCRFLEDPVRVIDWRRGVDAKALDLDWATKAVVVSDTEMDITMVGGSGKKYSCPSPRGVAYVVNRMTRKAESILICLNPLEKPKDWAVSGLFITKEDRLAGVCEEQMKLLQKVDAGIDRVEVQLGRIEAKIDNLAEQERHPEPVTQSRVLPPTVFVLAKMNGQEVVGKIKRKSVVTIEWSSTYTTECRSLTGIGFHTNGLISGVATTPPLKHDELYTVECTGLGGSASSRVYLDINNHNGLWIGGLTALLAGAVVLSDGDGGKEPVRGRPPV